MKECLLIYNTRWGYCLTPTNFKSIAAALRDTKQVKMAYRIFVNGKCIRRGWCA